MANPTEMKGGIHVELGEAKVKQVTLKDGTATVTVACEIGDFKATRKDLDKLSNESFEGFVVIEGAIVEQEELGFEDKDGKDDKGGDE
jgi:hypothetical protein